MNNGFGLNFLRFVCEEDANSWSQVFARLPFDETELRQKGALFGLVRDTNTEGWADVEVEMTNWVEEYFNGVETGGGLADFFVKFREKYPTVTCLWLWITLSEGVRKIKIQGEGEVSLVVKRGGSLIDLTESIKTKRVVLGELKTGDEIRMWLGDLSDDFEKWEEKKDFEGGGSYAAFKIVASAIEATKEEERVVEEVAETAKEELPLVKEEVVEEKEVLVSDRYVGPTSPFLRIKSWWLSRRKYGVVVDGGVVRERKKWPIALGSVFLLLLVVSLFFGNIRKKGIEEDKRWSDFSGPIEKSLGDALGLAKINNQGAKKMVEDSRASYNLKKGEFESEKFKESVANLGKKIEDAWVVVSGEKSGSVTDVVNLALIRPEVNAVRLGAAVDGKFVVMSSVSGLVMSADTKTKEVKVVAGKGAGLGWIDSASDGSKYYVMNKGGVFAVGNESNSLSFDTAITDPVSLTKFGNSIYVLEKGNKEIFKFLTNETGFGERTRWLKEDQVIGSTPVDMDIDVDIWVLEEKGVVERFRRGAKEIFSVSGLPEGVEFEKITVEKNGDRIALLSTKSGAVLFCSKLSGVCSQQIKTERLKEARDIEFDGEGKLMVLLPSVIGVLN